MSSATSGPGHRLASGAVGQATARRAPTTPRILEVDALRGFALGGILLANVLVMAGPFALTGGRPEETGADLIAHWLVAALVESKFYLLFSFLFGYSFTLQTSSAERAGASFERRMLRRLLALFVLGVTHAVLLYSGDILTTYAVLGLVLFASRRASPERVWRAALWLYGVIAVLLLLAAASATVPASEFGTAAEAQAEAHALTEAYRGGLADVVAANIRALPELLLGTLVAGGHVVTAFLVGFVAGRRRSLAGNVSASRLRRSCVIGGVVGVPGGVLMALGTVGPLSDQWEVPAFVLGLVAAPALSVAYASGLLLWFRTARGARVASWLAPAGRMALTNYLLQSLVMALVFYGYGLGLYGRTGAAAAVCGALVLYVTQSYVSARLMRRFRYGPVEWVLRAVTVAGRPGEDGGVRKPLGLRDAASPAAGEVRE
ncbi:DUF418 domain-containing protein [Streptomyces alkaliterrae]|nr:DUF418 domain-containing protein [Streptomyces alkaliterrae]